jgi:hypothetical protein
MSLGAKTEAKGGGRVQRLGSGRVEHWAQPGEFAAESRLEVGSTAANALGLRQGGLRVNGGHSGQQGIDHRIGVARQEPFVHQIVVKAGAQQAGWPLSVVAIAKPRLA